jgi:hypothetical protein
MYCGVYFVVPEHNSIRAWRNIIEVLSTHKSNWSIDCLDAYDETREKVYDSQELLALFRESSDIISARAIGIPVEQELDRMIYTYQDYLISNCHSIVFCYDIVYFEVYAKDFSLIRQLYESSSIDIEPEIAELIDDSNNSRTAFVV